MATDDIDCDDYDHDYDHDYDDEGHSYDCDCEECTYERAVDECGLLPEHLGGGCQMAGTEHCDWDCPFSRTEDAEDDDG